MIASEKAAWRRVLALADALPRSVARTELMQIAADMLDQVAEGIHTNPRGYRSNPALAIWANPGTMFRVTPSELLSKRAFSLAYRHEDDGQDYEHKFSTGVDVVTVKLGNGVRGVLLVRPDGRELWKDFL